MVKDENGRPCIEEKLGRHSDTEAEEPGSARSSKTNDTLVDTVLGMATSDTTIRPASPSESESELASQRIVLEVVLSHHTYWLCNHLSSSNLKLVCSAMWQVQQACPPTRRPGVKGNFNQLLLLLVTAFYRCRNIANIYTFMLSTCSLDNLFSWSVITNILSAKKYTQAVRGLCRFLGFKTKQAAYIL